MFCLEDGLKRLDEINKELSAPDIELKDSLTLYKEGMDLVAKCQEYLTGVEKAIQEVKIE